jgi:hypothetical protein
MANPEHVAVVRQGAEAVWTWKKAHPGERLDLVEANLRGVFLRGVNLSGENLHGANLEGAYLETPFLDGADLSEANLRAACLIGAQGGSRSRRTKNNDPYFYGPGEEENEGLRPRLSWIKTPGFLRV